jgi:hypothetical protein
MTALMMPVFVGAAGLTSDTIQMAFIRRVMQRQADSGAIAGAFALTQGYAAADTVTTDLARNNNYPLTVAPVIENAPTVGPYAGNARAVRVALATDAHLPFVGFFMGAERITAEATAAVVGLGEYCAIALEPTTAAGIYMSGSTTVNLNCGLMTNSISSSAVSATGSSNVLASPVAAVGGLPASNNYATGVELFPYSVPQADPYASLANPSIGNGSNAGNVGSNQVKSLNPGTYAGMKIQGTANLAPGVYYIDGGSLSIGSQAVVNGTGVTFVLTSKSAGTSPSSIATMDINGGSTLNITAPTTGTYAGVLMYQDRRAPNVGQTNNINGNSVSKLQGAIYFPNQEVQFTGTSGMNINCIKLVARRITFIGNSTINNVCPANSGVASMLGTKVKLVG